MTIPEINSELTSLKIKRTAIKGTLEYNKSNSFVIMTTLSGIERSIIDLQYKLAYTYIDEMTFSMLHSLKINKQLRIEYSQELGLNLDLFTKILLSCYYDKADEYNS